MCVNIVVNSSLDINTSVNVNSFVAMNDSVNYMEMCNKCLVEAELIKQHNIVEKDEYNNLSKRFSKLEQHCISLELAMQLNKENFQKNNTSVNQIEPSFDQLFELNNLKVELQAKDTKIEKLKANIKRLNKPSITNSVKNDIDEIETINIELEHRVAKLIVENEHLKQTYNQTLCFIKTSRVRVLKEHVVSLVNQLDQNVKDIVDNAAQVSNATTIAPGMYKLDPITLAPKDKNNGETHIYYLKHTMEQAAILREIVKQAKSLNPLDSASYSACNSMFDARHELCFLEFVSDMNASSKSKSVMKAKKKEEWNYRKKIGNACPLTRIAATNKVPLREPIPLEVTAQESVVTKIYTTRPKVPKTNGSNSKPKIAKSVISNKTKPDTSRGSNTSVALSSSFIIDLSKKQSHKPKSEDTNQEKLYLLHMDLCGPMRVASLNGKKYILVIVDDYSRFTWVNFLASKDKAPDFIIKFLKMIQVRLNATVRNIYTDNGTEFVNQPLLRQLLPHVTPKTDPLYDNAIEKLLMSSYMIENPIYPTFISLAHFSIQAMILKIIKTVNVDFDDLTAMASEQLGSEPGFQSMTPATSSSGLVPNPIPQQPCIPPPRDDWDRLFQSMFDEYFNPPTIATSPVLVANAPRADDLADSPVCKSIDQDASSTSIPST
ncbi:pyruvate, phosphate dikinase regulatory protein, chloroplastic [Tanacetum coccineum]|uniref:Pyruvate, phosphate dikinase regulatory protein, chloroplastic n=1 Tax=Tanacetum coccineum TaxID=301880 RepID=A0ABQ5I157_9ASTR